MVKSILRNLGCLGILVLVAPFCFAGQSNARGDAALGFANYKKQVNDAMNNCATESASKTGDYFIFLKEFWNGRNLPMNLASERILANGPDANQPADLQSPYANALSFMAKLASADPKQRYQACDTLSSRFKADELEFANVAEGDAKVLMAVFDENAAWKNLRRNSNFTTGCMKGAWNAGKRDFSVVKAMCSCQTEVIIRAGTDQQIADWVKQTDGKGADAAVIIQNMPWFQAAIPELAACVSGK